MGISATFTSRRTGVRPDTAAHSAEIAPCAYKFTRQLPARRFQAFPFPQTYLPAQCTAHPGREIFNTCSGPAGRRRRPVAAMLAHAKRRRLTPAGLNSLRGSAAPARPSRAAGRRDRVRSLSAKRLAGGDVQRGKLALVPGSGRRERFRKREYAILVLAAEPAETHLRPFLR